MTPPVKLGGDGSPTTLTVYGEREVPTIVHPMVMGFDGMTHVLHPRLMKLQGILQLRGLMNHANQLGIDEVVKNGVKGGVQFHGYA